MRGSNLAQLVDKRNIKHIFALRFDFYVRGRVRDAKFN
nr:MAG TPA: hypothetical protein [Inoviridae sp.]